MAINRVVICGNLVRDPEVRYESKTQKAVARITVALDRGKTADGVDRIVVLPVRMPEPCSIV